MIDILLTTTGDGFDITESDGLFTLTSGIQSAVMLSVAGGNVDDAKEESTDRKQYWANLEETDDAKKLRSETLYLLNTLPVTSGNAGRLADSINRDLAWLLESEYVSDLTTSVRIVGPRRVEFSVKTPEGSITFQAPWLG